MHLTSSLIVTGVVIYASQGVGSGESGPPPRKKRFRFILGCDVRLLFSTVCISHLTCVMLMQVHCVGCSTGCHRVTSHSHSVKLCACWCRSYGNLARQSCVPLRAVLTALLFSTGDICNPRTRLRMIEKSFSVMVRRSACLKLATDPTELSFERLLGYLDRLVSS